GPGPRRAGAIPRRRRAPSASRDPTCGRIVREAPRRVNAAASLGAGHLDEHRPRVGRAPADAHLELEAIRLADPLAALHALAGLDVHRVEARVDADPAHAVEHEHARAAPPDPPGVDDEPVGRRAHGAALLALDRDGA